MSCWERERERERRFDAWFLFLCMSFWPLHLSWFVIWIHVSFRDVACLQLACLSWILGFSLFLSLGSCFSQIYPTFPFRSLLNFNLILHRSLEKFFYTKLVMIFSVSLGWALISSTGKIVMQMKVHVPCFPLYISILIYTCQQKSRS